MVLRMVAGFFIGAVAGWVFNQNIISVLICAVAGAYFAKRYANRPPSRAFHKIFNPKEALREESWTDKNESKKESSKTGNVEE